jgi:nitroimidazol reductase NimA-like FMN-containing flavoprotein (pyridoxamine 5'-phosphate oxidase superfamily)
MLIESMNDRECRELLARKNVARLACSLNNQPYVVPINVDYHGRALYGFSMLGQKIEWMRANPLVCVEVDELTLRRSWETIILFGVYEELTDIPANTDARNIAQRLFQRHPAWWEPATVPLNGHELRSPILFRILINRMTGRRARPEREEEFRPSAEASHSSRARWLGSVVRWLRNRQDPH